MRNQKRFIQIPLLIAIITGVLVLGGGGYFGVRQYQSYQTEKIEKERVVQGKEKAAQELAAAQQKELDETKQEIEDLKKQSEEAKKKQGLLEQKIWGEEKLQSQNISISATELDPYLTGVGEIKCFGTGQKSGSASLWNLGETIGYAALTNQHVVSGNENCNLTIENSSTDSKHSGLYRLDKTQTYSWNPYTDISALKLTPLSGATDYSVIIQNLNYRISSMRQCATLMQLGSPIVIIGFPIFSKTSVVINGHVSSMSSRTITNGIISAYDLSIEEPIGNLPYPNYYVSAKIDSGNSGGIAFSKDLNGLCLLGVPTWLALGNYETQGVVQNIHNVMYKE